MRNKVNKVNKKVLISSITAILVASGMGGYVVVKKSDCQKGNISSFGYKIERIIDGDTIKIKSTDEETDRIRLLGIDAPELKECYGKEAKEALTELIAYNNIKIEKDISGVDDFGRLLRYIMIIPVDERQDSILVNQYLVRNGFAFHYPKSPDNRYRNMLASAQTAAKKDKLGMWGACDYTESKQDLENKARREEASVPTDPKCIIKGNISEKGYGKTYLVPGCDNYNSVKIDIKKGEGFFCTEKEAVKAGFRKATNCP